MERQNRVLTTKSLIFIAAANGTTRFFCWIPSIFCRCFRIGSISDRCLPKWCISTENAALLPQVQKKTSCYSSKYALLAEKEIKFMIEWWHFSQEVNIVTKQSTVASCFRLLTVKTLPRERVGRELLVWKSELHRMKCYRCRLTWSKHNRFFGCFSVM